MIAEYATALDDLPSIRVFHEKATNTYWLADGCHTVMAAKSLGREDIKADIREGSYEDAFRHGSLANQKRGLWDRNKDKRARAATAIKKFPGRSNRWIADLASVSHWTVNTIRPPSEVEESSTSTRSGKDGKQYPAYQPATKTTKPRSAAPNVPADAPQPTASVG